MTEEETIPSMMPSMAPVEEEEETNIMKFEEIAMKTQARLQKTLRHRRDRRNLIDTSLNSCFHANVCHWGIDSWHPSVF